MIQDDSFVVNDNGCVLSNSLSLFYAIAVATASGANNIYMTGVDGYDKSDPRYEEIVLLFSLYLNLDDACPIYSITPSTYPISQRSVYDPGL